MTERRTAEQALAERRRLLSHLVEAQELERRRIAWDVHDDSIQAMVAVGMRLQLLAGRLPEEHQPMLRQLEERCARRSGGCATWSCTCGRPRSSSTAWCPRSTGYLQDVVAGVGPQDRRCPPSWTTSRRSPTAITIFRICQEALINVRKHARRHAGRRSR